MKPWHITCGDLADIPAGEVEIYVRGSPGTGEARAARNIVRQAIPLLQAAEALLKDWDTPDLNDTTPISVHFDALREAAAAARKP